VYIFVFWGLLVIVAAGLVGYYSDANSQSYEYQIVSQPMRVDYSDFVNKIETGSLTQVRFRGGYIYGYSALSNNPSVYTRIPKMSYKFVAYLIKKNVRIGVDSNASTWWTLAEPLIHWLVVGTIVLMAVSILRRRRDYFSGLNWISSSVKTVTPPKFTFADVAGANEAKNALEEVVNFLKNPKKFSRLGAKIPKGVLLYGPPGTGKTLLAKCTAGESNASFLYSSGSAFVNLYVGMGARNVRDLFDKARNSAPCVIFIDEVDAIAGSRQGGLAGTGSDEHAHALTELLSQMDGFNNQEDVTIVVIAATNRVDALDPAVLRPGRFDRKIYVGNPDINGRKEILSIYLKKIKADPEIDVTILAKKTQGFSGADLQNFVNEAALRATLNVESSTVKMEDFDGAWLTIALGPKRSLQRTDEQKALTAYHEAGHAIIGALTPGCDPIHTITIVPHGQAAGLVLSLPSEDTMDTKSSLLARIKMALGGRAAEELIFGPDKVTTGAISDFQTVTKIANTMVFQVGMGEEGDVSSYQYHPERFSSIPESVLSSRSEKVREIIKNAYKEALDLLKKERNLLEKVVKHLLERETLTGEEFQIILDGGELPSLEAASPLVEKEGKTELQLDQKGMILDAIDESSGTVKGDSSDVIGAGKANVEKDKGAVSSNADKSRQITDVKPENNSDVQETAQPDSKTKSSTAGKKPKDKPNVDSKE
jgi:cell division protease FtsH